MFSFKQFMAEDMDPSMDKTLGKKGDYFDGLGEEMGIEWEDIIKTFEHEPWISAHFNLGKMKHKLTAWEIVPGSLSEQGCSIRLKPQKGSRSYLSGNRLNKGGTDDKVYFLNRKQLAQFLTTGWTPAVQAAQGAGDMGMGGGMGGDMGGGMPPDMGGGQPMGGM